MVIASIALSLQASEAANLVYMPVNPMFGGNPGNGPNLMGIATAQNGFKAPKAPAITPLQRFQNSLQQAILNQLSTQIKDTTFGTNGTTITPGTYDAGNYTVTIVSGFDASNNPILTITTTDKTNGATATFEVSTL